MVHQRNDRSEVLGHSTLVSRLLQNIYLEEDIGSLTALSADLRFLGDHWFYQGVLNCVAIKKV